MSVLLRMYPGDAWALLIVNVLAQVTVVILAAWFLARLGSRWNAAWRHTIYLVTVVCVLASPALSSVMRATGIALVTLRPSVPTAPPAEPARIPTAPIPESSLIEMPAAAQITASRAPLETEALGQGLQHENLPSVSFSDVLRALGGSALVIWLLGMALLLARWCYGLHLIAALRRAAEPLDRDAMAGLLHQVRQTLGADRLPPIATSTDLDRPVMIGLMRPLVILPENALRTLHEPELADILVHECAHAVCRHQLVGLLQRLAGMLFWPHPLVHLLNRELARAREEVCDNYVLRRSNAPHYARTLLELSQLLVGVSPKPAALGLFHCRWKLEDRVADLLDRRRMVMIRVNRWTAAAMTATFLMLTLLIAGTSILQAAPIERRVVNKIVRAFPEETDLSTPESAMAASSRRWAQKNVVAALGMSWVKWDTETAKMVEDMLKHDPQGPTDKDFRQMFLDAEIIDVLTYHDDFAVVIYKGDLNGAGPYGGVSFGKINGVWKSLSLGLPLGDSAKDLSSPSVKAVTERVERKKDDFWRHFVEVRSEVLNGRTPLMTDKGLSLSAVEFALPTLREGGAPVMAAEESGAAAGLHGVVSQSQGTAGDAPKPPAVESPAVTDGTAEANRVQAAAIAEIKKLGGIFTVDEKSPAKPVIRVDLASTKATDADLEHLKGLTQLQWLGLYGTQVTDAGLEHLKGLTQLQWLNLDDTKVTDAGMECLKGFSQLQTLGLGNTQVTDAGLKDLKGLSKLVALSLGGTQVTDAGLEYLKGLPQLQRLCLDGTKVTDAGVKDLQQALPKVRITRSGLAIPPSAVEKGAEEKVEPLPRARLFAKPKDGTEQAKAIAEIEWLGGKVGVDDNSPGKPVISVNLGNSEVTDDCLEYLKGFSQLQTLNLSHTPVTDAGLEHLKMLSELQVLDLGGTKVTDAGLEHLKGFTKLRDLKVGNTQVTDAGLEHLKGLTQLHKVELLGTKVTDAGLEHLKGLSQLQVLDLGGTKVTDAGLEHLKGFTKLQMLFLVETKVTDTGLEHLKGLSHLQALVLPLTKVTDAGLEHFKGFLQLRLLDLGFTQVTDAGLEHLKGLSQLQWLSVRDTKVTDIGVKDLQQALPKVQIRR